MDLKAAKTAGQHQITFTLSGSESVLLQFDQLKRHKDGRLNCRIKALRRLPDKDVNLYQASLNLMAGRSRSQLANTLKSRMPIDEVDFERFVEEACRLVVEGEEEATGAEQLTLSDETETGLTNKWRF